jgi:sugar phosphate isomerase/epimerase
MNLLVTANLDRRTFLATASTALASAMVGWSQRSSATTPDSFKLKYLLASCMYGYAALDVILPEVKHTGATAIDIWPMKHGNQREQLDKMGEDSFVALLAEHDVRLGCLTRYHTEMEALHDEMRLCKRLKCPLLVTAAQGLPKIADKSVKGQLRHFFETMKPHLAVAEENGVTIALENHGGNPISSAESLKWFAELRPTKHLALAYSPYHLQMTGQQHAELLREVGDAVALFYAWQHGLGSKTKLPREQELLQMPGRGDLDFVPIVDALRSINYQGWTEIFMHPFPRGKPIVPTTAGVTAEITRARSYLDRCLQESATANF